MRMESKLTIERSNEKLIDLVKKYPVLYQLSHKNYKDNAAKEDAWTAIAAALNKDVTDCKVRWRRIRDSYRKNKNKLQNRSTIDSTAPSKSKYNDERLKFLDESFKERTLKTKSKESTNNRKSVEIFAEENESKTSEDDRESVETGAANNVKKNIKDNATAREQAAFTKPSLKRSDSIDDDHNSRSVSIAKKHKAEVVKDREFDGIAPGNENRNQTLDNFSTDNKRNEIPENPIETFFRSMGRTVMTFSPHLIAETRMKVCNIVSEMELRSLSEQQKQKQPLARQSLPVIFNTTGHDSSSSSSSSS